MRGIFATIMIWCLGLLASPAAKAQYIPDDLEEYAYMDQFYLDEIDPAYKAVFGEAVRQTVVIVFTNGKAYLAVAGQYNPARIPESYAGDQETLDIVNAIAKKCSYFRRSYTYEKDKYNLLIKTQSWHDEVFEYKPSTGNLYWERFDRTLKRVDRRDAIEFLVKIRYWQ